MTVRTGLLLIGAEPVANSINSSVRGFADPGGVEEPVFAKALPDVEILAEVYCALLCRSVGLPAPEPLILKDQATGKSMFASVELPHPNLGQFLNLQANDPGCFARVGAVLSKWPALPRIVAFDEWIDNRDRHLGNILWQDENQFVLIDHGKVLNINPNDPDRNRLLEIWLVSTGGDQVAQQRLKKAAVSFVASLDETMAVECVSEMCMYDSDWPSKFSDFVCSRLAHVGRLLSNRFPNAQVSMPI